MPRPCRSESDLRPQHSAAWAWLSASSGYHAEFHEGCYHKHTNPLNCRNSSSDISGYHADFHEGHGTAGEWQGHGMACVNSRGTAWHGRVTAWVQHGWCELAFMRAKDHLVDPGADRRLLRWIFSKLDVRAGTGSRWLGVGTGGGLMSMW
jgi:hypothetical protein